MAKDVNQFLRFSAYSMKDLITRKLSESSEFTDQIYEGSNLAILIDLVSYMYQVLVYQLNNAASESMFQDTQIYENINRLVNLIGYSPKGCYPAAIRVNVTNTDPKANFVNIPAYARLDTGLTAADGKRIYFSTRSFQEKDQELNAQEDNNIADITLYNGQWKLYSTVFAASGYENETFVLEQLYSDSEAGKYVAGDFIDVYILHDNGMNYDIEKAVRDENGFVFNTSDNTRDYSTENTTLYSNSGNFIYSVRLNRQKQYELHFGDGIVGKKLLQGDRVIIVYLDTNGPSGEIDLASLDFSNLRFENGISAQIGMNNDLYAALGGAIQTEDPDKNPLSAYQISPFTYQVAGFKEEESVNDIRNSAPNWFKLGNRLITKADYEYFFKNSHSVAKYVSVIDAKCMNNTEYAARFYKWLYKMGMQYFNDGQRYFQQSTWQRTDYRVMDPADSGNTYMWIVPDRDDLLIDKTEISLIESNINHDLKPIKTMTTDIQILNPVIVNFDICAAPIDRIRENYNGAIFDENCESYLEITLDDDTLYVSASIQDEICRIIEEAFDRKTCVFGQNIDVRAMTDRIYAIAGVKRVRTIYFPDENDVTTSRAYDGISFASWTPLLNGMSKGGDGPNSYVDVVVSNGMRHIEDFQFPHFSGSSMLRNRIKLIKKTLTTVNTIKM